MCRVAKEWDGQTRMHGGRGLGSASGKEVVGVLVRGNSGWGPGSEPLLPQHHTPASGGGALLARTPHPGWRL